LTRAASLALAQAQRSLEAARAIVEPLDDAALARSEHEAAAAGQALMDAEREHKRSLAEIEQLEGGKTPRPDGLEEFRALLEARGIVTTLLADELEIADQAALAAEAVLDRGVWTLVVPAERYEAVIELAREQGYRLPLARTGNGTPHGILSAAHGAPGAGAYLAEVDLLTSFDGEPGVAPDGLVRGRQWAQFRAPEQPVLGERARRKALAHTRAHACGPKNSTARCPSCARRARKRACAQATSPPAWPPPRGSTN
jgi:hypothetical protein